MSLFKRKPKPLPEIPEGYQIFAMPSVSGTRYEFRFLGPDSLSLKFQPLVEWGPEGEKRYFRYDEGFRKIVAKAQADKDYREHQRKLAELEWVKVPPHPNG